LFIPKPVDLSLAVVVSIRRIIRSVEAMMLTFFVTFKSNVNAHGLNRFSVKSNDSGRRKSADPIRFEPFAS